MEITPALLADLPKNGPTDPIEFYRRPLVGWLFRERINRGLRLLDARRFARALEVGYGAGAVQLALAPSVDELHGLDLDADPAVVESILKTRGLASKLARGSVTSLPYEDGSFDLVVCFSVFEHLRDYDEALAEVARVLRPSGLFLLGMPRVDVAMEVGFRSIGFKGIEHHHVTTPASVARCFADRGLRVSKTGHLDVPRAPPLGVRLYFNWLLQKVA